MRIQFDHKTAFDEPSTVESINIDCPPDHTLVDVLAVFVQDSCHFLWFSFYDSNDELFDKNQTLQQYASHFKENEMPIIRYTARVTLKFRVKPDALDSWCLHHGPTLDFAPTPEIQRSAGFDCEMKLFKVCDFFANNGGLKHQTMDFYDSDLQPLLTKYEEKIKLKDFFKHNGPVIFFEIKPDCVGTHFSFYLKTSHKPHSSFKELRWGDEMTVDELSGPNYQHHQSSLLRTSENGDIMQIINGAKFVKELIQDGSAMYRLDNFDFAAETRDYFNVSVRFVNGGDMFTDSSSILIQAEAETINSFSKKLLEKMFGLSAQAKFIGKHNIKNILSGLIIDVGDGHRRKGNSMVKIRSKTHSNTIPVYTADLKRLPTDLKYCDINYEFYFYDRSMSRSRINFTYKKVIGHITDHFSNVIERFADKVDRNRNYQFYSSRGFEIDAELMQSMVNEYARKNDLVIYYKVE